MNRQYGLMYALHREHLNGPALPKSTARTPSSPSPTAASGVMTAANGIWALSSTSELMGITLTVVRTKRGLQCPRSTTT